MYKKLWRYIKTRNDKMMYNTFLLKLDYGYKLEKYPNYQSNFPFLPAHNWKLLRYCNKRVVVYDTNGTYKTEIQVNLYYFYN